MKILLGITGSVASILTPSLVKSLLDNGFGTKIVATKPSLYFWNFCLSPIPVHVDEDEWVGEKYEKDDPILHIELRNWADLLLIAPLSANTLAKLANGLSDNLLTSVARAWDRQKPVVICPAMNTHMWEHPATAEHLEKLSQWYPNLTIINPVSKHLACGDVGMGAMAPIEAIVESLLKGGK